MTVADIKSLWSKKSTGVSDHSLLTNLDYDSSWHTGFESSLPATPDNPTTKFLDWNRQWSQMAISWWWYAANIYFTTQDSDISWYKKLSYTNELAETELTWTMEVPTSDQVLLWVPNDKTVWTLIMTPAWFWGYDKASITASKSIGVYLKQTATVESVGYQIAALTQ